MYRKLLPILIGFILLHALTGCAVKKIYSRKRVVQSVPRVLVLPFPCENDLVGLAISQGFIASLDKKTEILTQGNFDLFLTSRSLKIEYYFDSESFAKGSPAYWQEFGNQLLKDQETRKEMQMDTDIDFFVVGSAHEKILSELEADNLQTAETAQIKFVDLQTGETLAESSFKQGYFEIVAPDRIGSKLAAKVNAHLTKLRKSAKQKK